MSKTKPRVSIHRIDATLPNAATLIEELALQRASELANLTTDLKHAGFHVQAGSQVFKYQTDTTKVELCAKAIVGLRNGERVEFQSLDIISSPLKPKRHKREEDNVNDS